MNLDALLQEVASSLPAAEDVESNGEDGGEAEGDGGVSIFTRSDHLLSLGFQDSHDQLSDKREQLHGINEAEDSIKDGVSSARGENRTETRKGDTEWDQFRTHFMEQLKSSDHEVKVEMSDPSAMKKHLLMKAITELHHHSSENQEQEEPRGTNSVPSNEPSISTEDIVTQAHQHSAPDTSSSKLRPGHLLSTSLLDEIEISTLDRALEQVDIIGTSRTAVALPEHPRMAWEESDDNKSKAPNLMSQLTALSTSILSGETQEGRVGVKELSERVGIVARRTVNSSSDRIDENEKKTDLRQSYHQPERDRVTSMHANQSISESEESDNDPTSWALKRKQIKSTLSPTNHNSHTPSVEPSDNDTAKALPASAAIDIVHKPSDQSFQVVTQKRREKKQKKKMDAIKSEYVCSEVKKDDSDSTTLRELLFTQDEDVGQLYGVVPVNNSSSDSALLSSSSSSIQSHHMALTDEPPQVQSIGRHHSTESFALSSELSSFSEGEITKSIEELAEKMGLQFSTAAGGKGDEKGKEVVTKKSKKKRKSKGRVKDVDSECPQDVAGSPETGRAQLETKQKMGKKKGKSNQKTEKSKKGDSKKKISVTRRRLDSLTTSSDEERVFEPPCLSQVVEVAEERKVDEEDKERLIQKMEYKIISKKPPALFETPTTKPLFHKDVSFSPVISHMCSSMSTDALLVLPLSPSHGLVSLPPSHPHISPEAHLVLHSLILTCLCFKSYSATVKQSWMNRSASPSPSSSKLSLKITALYQTILDGQLSILMGVSLPQGRKRSVSYPTIVQQGAKMSTGAVLYPLDARRNPFAEELDGILCGLKLKDMLQDILHKKEVDCSKSCTGEGAEGIVIPLDILNEIQPLLELSAQVFLSVYSDTEPLTKPTSFYWHSLYNPDSLPTSEALCTTQPLQSTVCSLPFQSLANPSLVYHALHGAHDFGLSIAGMRLVHGESCFPLDLPSPTESDDTISDFSVALVLCLRGPDAVSQCMDLVGPEDYSLALVTDPDSIVTRYGGPHNQPMYCVRTPFRVPAALAKWFGGRACLRTGTVLGMTDPWTRSERRKRQRVRFSESDFESEDNFTPLTPDVSFPPLVANQPLLTVLPYEQELLVVSPLVPPVCYSSILSTCARLGFDISGIKRVRLNSKRAAVLDIPDSFVSHFTPSSTPPSPELATFSGHPLAVDQPLDIPPLPSLLLIVCRENALVQSCALKTAIIADLKNLLSLNPHLQSSLSLDNPMGALLHAVPYNAERLKVLGGFSNTAVMSASSLPQLASEWARDGERYGEEISFLAVTQASGLTKAVELLQLMFGVKTEKSWGEEGAQLGCDNEDSDDYNLSTQYLGGFELLGIKLIPQLSRFHAKQLCPISSSEHTYLEAIEHLSGSPALVLVVRAIACNGRLQKLLSPTNLYSRRQSRASLSLIASDSFHQAFRYTTMFFTDKELFCDPASWTLLCAVPSEWARTDVLHDYQEPPPLLSSVLVAESGEWRSLVKVMDRLHRVGFQLCGLTMKSDEQQQESPEDTTGQMSNEVALCVSRQNAVWYLNNELRPLLSTSNQKKRLKCPTVFSDAVSLVHQYFPRGLCGPESPVVTNYGVKQGLVDDFSGLQGGLSSHPPTSPLSERTCIILPPSHLTSPPHHPTPRYLQLLELVVQTGFSVTGIQLTHLSQDSVTALSSFGTDTKELLSGPCLILLLERDNAASCFRYILTSSASQYSLRGVGATSVDVDDLLGGAIVPDSPKTAAALIAALVKEE